MKKTIVAAAIAAVVAAPAAFAEVSISGQINAEFTTDSDDVTSAVGVDTANTMFGAIDQNAGEDGLENDVNVDIVLQSTEDLGNGMKLSAKIHLLQDSGTQGTADESIALSGDFGTVVVGRMEDFTESRISAVADTWDPVDGFSLENQNTASGRTNGGLAYVSPSMNGLTIGVAGYAVENGQLNALATSTVATDAGDAKFDATDVMISYSNGPLAVTYTRESIDGDAVAVGRQDQDSDNVAVSYKMGDLTLAMTWQDVTDNLAAAANNDAQSTFVGAKYAMGNNELSLGYTEIDLETAGADAGEDNGYIVGFKHNMSKSTNVYAAYQSQTAERPAAADIDNDRFAVGIKHTF
jgi:hypothetical protein